MARPLASEFMPKPFLFIWMYQLDTVSKLSSEFFFYVLLTVHHVMILGK